jgi:hypothetical protein
VSRKSVPKRKGGIPLDELLAATRRRRATLDRLVERYGRDVVPALSKLAPASACPFEKAAHTCGKRLAIVSTMHAGVKIDRVDIGRKPQRAASVGSAHVEMVVAHDCFFAQTLSTLTRAADGLVG